MAFIPDAQPIETINPHEAALRQQTGALANGQLAPSVAMVDTQAGPGAPTQAPPPTRFVPDAPPPKAPAKPDVIGEANKKAEQSEHGPVQDLIDMVKAAPGGAWKMLESLGNGAIEHPILGNLPAITSLIQRVVADPRGTLTSASNAVQNATPQQVGANVVGPLALGGLAGEGVGAANAARTAAVEAAATPAGNLGLRTATGPGATMAGNTAGTTMDIANQRAATTVLGADAGVPHTSPVNATTLATAREAPGQVLDAGYAQLPTGPLTPGARAQVTAARGPATITPPTPNVANRINAIESSLVDPNGQFTGEQLRATRNSLNSDADAGANSDDADTRVLSDYQRRVVKALDTHMAESTPPGAAITPEQITNARSTLAKNYQLQDLIGKGGDIDLQALAKLHRDNPNMLTGNTRTVAQFASDHPEVTGAISDNTRISPPSLLNDIANVDLIHRPIGSIGQALFGAVGRRLLRGPNGEAIGQAMQAPVAGLGGEFDLNPLTDLRPPPGNAGGPAQRPLDLSGEATLAPNLNLEPPPGTALEPAQRRLFGDQPLADLFSNQRGSMSLRDINRTTEVPGNGNETSGGASLEAANRGSGNFIHWDGDTATPVIGDVNQVDKLTPPKGSVTINADTGELVSSGNTPRGLVNGLLARWKAHSPLGREF